MFVVKKNVPEANIPRTIRFTEPLFAELNEIAAECNVSFNSLVLQCCRYAIDGINKDDDPETP
jgi:predicted DNA-binding ribbon-helix-helix protein